MKDNTTLSRDISFNQLMMIALGGTIGTGLFVGTGGNIASAGPLATLLAYLIGGIIVYSIVLSLGELARCIPLQGVLGIMRAVLLIQAQGIWSFGCIG